MVQLWATSKTTAHSRQQVAPVPAPSPQLPPHQPPTPAPSPQPPRNKLSAPSPHAHNEPPSPSQPPIIYFLWGQPQAKGQFPSDTFEPSIRKLRNFLR